MSPPGRGLLSAERVHLCKGISNFNKLTALERSFDFDDRWALSSISMPAMFDAVVSAIDSSIEDSSDERDSLEGPLSLPLDPETELAPDEMSNEESPSTELSLVLANEAAAEQAPAADA